jgi:hypothetical protein
MRKRRSMPSVRNPFAGRYVRTPSASPATQSGMG